MSPSWIDFFLTPPGGVPCLGVVLGRKTLWAALARNKGRSPQIEEYQRVPLGLELFHGAPNDEAVSQLVESLAPVLQKWKSNYLCVQVALPDPVVKPEVFELDKVPAGRGPMEEFLKWRFKPASKEGEPSLSFATQLLGEVGGKNLVLGLAADKAWLETLRKAFRRAGAFVSVLDMAACHRLNFFHDEIKKKGTGSALVTFDPEYWNLTVVDKEARLRYIRSKWWDKEVMKAKDIPVRETMAEVERTIRSYVYAAKDRSVESLLIAAPKEWLKSIVDSINRDVEGGCAGLDMDQGLSGLEGREMNSPSVVATAVQR